MRSVALTRQGFPFALALLAGALLAPTPARGVTLGNIASQSALGHPLRVVIPISASEGEAPGDVLNGACLKLVADNAPGAPQIVTGKVSVERTSRGSRLVVTTRTAVNEPAVRLSVQAGCGGTSRRDYVLLLDPPALESPTVIAAEEGDEPAWISRPEPSTSRLSPKANANTRPVSAVSNVALRSTVSDAAPRLGTWGVPVAQSSPAPVRAVVDLPPSGKPQVQPKEAQRVVASPAVVQPALRELVAVASGSGAFIPEAAAAPLPPHTMLANSPRPSNLQSIPLVSHPQQQASSLLTTWRDMWQYAALMLGALGFAVAAFALRRRFAARPAWLTDKSRSSMKTETQATFAHFEAMTEPVSIDPRPAARRELPADQSSAAADLDTLLHDIQADTIDDKTIRDAWREAASDAAIDMGSDSILKAIEAAERDLQMAIPGTAQAAMDCALDEDLLTAPNAPAKRR